MKDFFSKQNNEELLLSGYFFALLLYVVIIFFLKRKNKKKIAMYMLKYRDIFLSITYIILGIFLVIGCLIYNIHQSLATYFGVMLAGAAAINYTYIIGVKKYKDVEFDIERTYENIIRNSEYKDYIMEVMSDCIDSMQCLSDYIQVTSIYSFIQEWLNIIDEYVINTIKSIDYALISDKKIIINFIKNKVESEDLWYTSKEIEVFADNLLNYKEVILSESSRIIPICTKQYNFVLYIEGKDKIIDWDRIFLINTCTVFSISLIRKEET